MPESLQDPVLGALDWDKQLEWWVGTVDVKSDHTVEIFISPNDDPPEAVLNRVRSAFDHIRSYDREYRHWTAQQVVQGRWNSEEVMTVEDITSLLRLASVDFHADGGAGLYWNDEDRLYGGHNLITEIDPGGKCIEVRIEG